LKKVRHYKDYKDYIAFQSKKTLNPEKRVKWLGEEWELKVSGFKGEFSKFGNILNSETKALCVGARTGQEVVALNEMGIVDAIGIDIIPHEPSVIHGDMHNLDFEDETFDFVYTNVIDHSIDPSKMMAEMERVLKVGGYLFLQCQVGIDQDEYTEFVIENPIHDVLSLTNTTFCSVCQPIQRNFAGMNFEYVFTKSQELTNLYKNYGAIEDIEVPEDYQELWNDINLPIQNKKLDTANIVSNKMRREILSNLMKRGFYLTRIAESFDRNRIVEVGTAEGWQFYNFCKYVSDGDSEKGFVMSCDPRDVRSRKYVEIYECDDRFNYFQETSSELASRASNVDLFYIDGLHDEGTVLRDVINLESTQCQSTKPVWILDDFDERFGCAKDIFTLCQLSRMFKVYEVGKTASGHPSHQALIAGHFQSQD